MANKIEEHVLVPKHSVVPEEEVQSLLEKLNATREKIPAILKGDPGIKKLKPKKGDMIKIERASHTAGKTIYYRVVK